MTMSIAFFETLAGVSDLALISVAEELARSRRFSDLMGLADFLTVSPAASHLRDAQTPLSTWSLDRAPSPATDLADLFALACTEATPQAHDLMHKVVRSGAVHRAELLDVLAQASPSASMLRIASEGAPSDVVAQSIDHALASGNVRSAMHLARSTHERMLAFCQKAERLATLESGSPVPRFAEAISDPHQVVELGIFLDEADRMMAAKGVEAMRCAAGLRMATVIEWLRRAHQSNTHIDPLSLAALMGSHLERPDESTILHRMQEFAVEIGNKRQVESQPNSSSTVWNVNRSHSQPGLRPTAWSASDSNKSHPTFLEVDFYDWVVRTHAAPLLALCRPVMEMAAGDQNAPGIFLAMQPKDWSTQSAREEATDRMAAPGVGFKETLLALIDAGHDLHIVPDEIARGATALQLLARMMNASIISESLGFERLAVLIEVGADPNILGPFFKSAEQTIAQEKRDRWIGVVNAVRSRLAAHAALEEMFADEPSRSNKASP